jgi:aminoglycoside 3-N-acetyltransferase
VLLLGVGHKNNSSLHLAEYRAAYPGKHDEIDGAPILVDGQRQWVSVHDLVLDVDDFVQIGEQFDAETDCVCAGNVGVGVSLLMSQRALVDYAVTWMEERRKADPESQL